MSRRCRVLAVASLLTTLFSLNCSASWAGHWEVRYQLSGRCFPNGFNPWPYSIDQIWPIDGPDWFESMPLKTWGVIPKWYHATPIEIGLTNRSPLIRVAVADDSRLVRKGAKLVTVPLLQSRTMLPKRSSRKPVRVARRETISIIYTFQTNSGGIQTFLQWVPDGPDDLPPMKVDVEESCYSVAGAKEFSDEQWSWHDNVSYVDYSVDNGLGAPAEAPYETPNFWMSSSSQKVRINNTARLWTLLMPQRNVKANVWSTSSSVSDRFFYTYIGYKAEPRPSSPVSLNLIFQDPFDEDDKLGGQALEQDFEDGDVRYSYDEVSEDGETDEAQEVRSSGINKDSVTTNAIAVTFRYEDESESDVISVPLEEVTDTHEIADAEWQSYWEVDLSDKQWYDERGSVISRLNLGSLSDGIGYLKIQVADDGVHDYAGNVFDADPATEVRERTISLKIQIQDGEVTILEEIYEDN